MNIRYATMADLDDIASVESVCFPVLEAATKEEFEQRIKYFGNHFWLMFDEGITDKSTHGNVLWHQMRLDFKLRNDTLILNTFFRSQDICKKMYADTICLTEILNDMAETLKIKNTQLNLYIMSAHIYENDFKRGKELINE